MSLQYFACLALLLLLLLPLSVHTQTTTRLFSLKPTTPWAATVPTIGGQILKGVFSNNFAFAVNSSTGAVTMLTNHTNPQFAFSSINTRIDSVVPPLSNSGFNCARRVFTITFAYTIPNAFYDLCSRDGAGMEAFFVMGSSIATASIPQGLGGAMTG